MYIIILVKQVYWYISRVSGERLQDHWSSGIALTIEDGEIDLKVDCYYIFSLNYGRYYNLVLYLTHKAQINDRSKGFVVERILRDPDETCVFMAPAIKGSFDTGS